MFETSSMSSTTTTPTDSPAGGNESAHTTTPACPTLAPALPVNVQITITVIFTVIFTAIFVGVLIQLIMIRCYRFKCLSYQCVFLLICLIWAGLRIALFSFYYKDASIANNFPTPVYWLLYCFPVCLQFMTLCILVEFFTSQVVLKTRTYYGPNSLKRWHVWIIIALCIAIFLTTNILCAVIEQQYQNRSESPPFGVLLARVLVNGALFMGGVIVLSFLLCIIGRTSVANMALEAQGITVRFAYGASTVIILLYTSRVVYNLIAVINPSIIDFGYNWVNVSDQVDFGDLGQGWAYVSYSAVLLAWEIIPTLLTVCFFRVKRRHSQMQMLAQITSESYHRRRLIQEDDGEQDRLYMDPDGASPALSPINYDSIVEVEFYTEHFGSYTQYDVPGTPPPLKIPPPHHMLFDGDSNNYGDGC